MLGIERDAVKWEAYAGAHHIQERQIVVIAHYLENLGTQVMLNIAFAVAPSKPHADMLTAPTAVDAHLWLRVRFPLWRHDGAAPQR